MHISLSRKLRLFLCHASNDKPEVRRLYKQLVSDGYDVWFDEKSLLPGQDWKFEIFRGIRNADVIVLCLSTISIAKEGYVQAEIKEALDIAKEKPEGTIFIIPVKFDECPVPKAIEEKWHWVNYFEEKGYEQLKKSLNLRLQGLIDKKEIIEKEVFSGRGDISITRKSDFKKRNQIKGDIFVDVHLFTSAKGGSGKTTILLNTLTYLARQNSANSSILIFDEADNSDFSEFWTPLLQFESTYKSTYHHEQSDISSITKEKILISAYSPLPPASRGFKWSSLAKIVESYIESLRNKRDIRISILVDTSASVGTLIRNAGAIGNLNSAISWRVFPWVIWTPSSLTNSRFIETTRLALNELDNSGQRKLGDQFHLYPIYIFNPVINADNMNYVNSVRLVESLKYIGLKKNMDKNVVILESLYAYSRLPTSKSIDLTEFFDRLSFSFVHARSLSKPMSSQDMYRSIGRVLQKVFSVKSQEGNLEKFANIFVISMFSPQLLSLSQTSNNLALALNDIKDSLAEEKVSALDVVSKYFEGIYSNLESALHEFYRVIR